MDREDLVTPMPVDNEEEVTADELFELLFPDSILEVILEDNAGLNDEVKLLMDMSWSALLAASSLLHKRVGIPILYDERLSDDVLFNHLRRRFNRLTRKLTSHSQASAPRVLPEPLTPREVEILRLVGVGMSNKQIAATLDIQPATVAKHLTNAYDKLGARSRVAALRTAKAYGLL